MSLIQAVASLTSRFNQFLANAKKVDELSPQEVLDVNSKIHVMIDGKSEYLTVQQIIDAYKNSIYKELISVGTISLTDQDITLADVIWRIAESQYTKSTVITIPLTDIGMFRTDIFVGYETGEIVRIAGLATSSISVAPLVPFNAVLITQISINSTTVGQPIDPIFGLTFLEKGGYSGGTAQTLADEIVEKASDSIATTININVNDLGLVSEEDITDTIIANYINSLSLEKSANEFYIVQVEDNFLKVFDLTTDLIQFQIFDLTTDNLLFKIFDLTTDNNQFQIFDLTQNRIEVSDLTT